VPFESLYGFDSPSSILIITSWLLFIETVSVSIYTGGKTFCAATLTTCWLSCCISPKESPFNSPVLSLTPNIIFPPCEFENAINSWARLSRLGKRYLN